MENEAKELENTQSAMQEHFSYGHVYLDQEDCERALEEFSLAAHLAPGDSNVLISLGRGYQTCGRSQEAVTALEKALALSPQFADAHFHMGQALLDAGQRDKAIDHFKEALNINPHYHAANLVLSRLLQDRGQDHKKLDEGTLAQERESRRANTHFHLGNALLRKNLFNEARAELKAAVRLRPNYPDFHNKLGELYFVRGLFCLAEEEFRLALKINPRYLTAAINLGHTLQDHANTMLRQARDMYARALEIDARNPQARQGLDSLRTLDQAAEGADAKP